MVELCCSGRQIDVWWWSCWQRIVSMLQQINLKAYEVIIFTTRNHQTAATFLTIHSIKRNTTLEGVIRTYFQLIT